MESKSAETSTGASAEIVLSIIGGGYFFVMITRVRSISCKCTMDYIVSVASALQEKKLKKMMCQSLTHRKMVILIIWIAAISLLLQLGKTIQLRRRIIPAQRI